MSKSKVAEEIAALREERWTTTDARRVLEACQASGLSMGAFARQHGLNAQRLSWWRKRLGEWGGLSAASSPALRLVPAVVQESRAVVDGRIAIRLPEGVVVEVCAVSPQWVASLVRELCGASS